MPIPKQPRMPHSPLSSRLTAAAPSCASWATTDPFWHKHLPSSEHMDDEHLHAHCPPPPAPRSPLQVPKRFSWFHSCAINSSTGNAHFPTVAIRRWRKTPPAAVSPCQTFSFIQQLCQQQPSWQESSSLANQAGPKQRASPFATAPSASPSRCRAWMNSH